MSERLQAVLPFCDLIVGTEEEVMIAGGAEDVRAALRAIRAASEAVIVLKRGAKGCIVYDGPIPDDLEQGVVGDGFPIEIYNVLGAGDAFISGFLRGWLRGESLERSATRANACGAIAVSRLLCSPEYPTEAEVDHFLAHGSKHQALRKDETLNHLHRATTRAADIPLLMAFAMDHRNGLEDMAARLGADPERIRKFKVLGVEAAARVAKGRPGYGMLIDEKWGRDALFAYGRHPFSWLGRPIELPGSRPLRLEFSQDLGSQLVEWPVDHCIKVLCFYRPDDAAELKEEQGRSLRAVYDAARKVGRELLVEIICGKHGPLSEDTVSTALAEVYGLGVKPDWWKLEPQASHAAWRRIEAVIAENDPYCRGVVMLGLEAPHDKLVQAFAAVSDVPVVKGFAVGRTLFMPAAEAWLGGRMSDEDAVADMAARFEQLTEAWIASRRSQAA